MNDSPLASAEWLALVAAMRFAPDDDTPRLVGADWLQETGKPELDAWAAFIRMQCEAAAARRGTIAGASHPPNNWCDCGSCRPERKATELFDRWGAYWHHSTWGGWNPAPNALRATDYTRGFVARIVIEITGAKTTYIPRQVAVLFDRQPVRQAIVQMWRQDYKVVPRLANFVCSIDIRPSTIVANSLRVKATLTMPPRTDVSVSGHRGAETGYQLRRAISASVRESLKKRSALTV